MFLAFSAVLAVVDSFAGGLAASVGARPPMAVGMALCAMAFLILSLLRPTSSLTIVIAALLVAGVGQALAYTVSTTGGMQAIPEAKAGAASRILSMIRLVGAVFGVAVTGALFKAMENDKLAELLVASGAKLSSSDRAEIRGLLSGSDAAENKLARLAPSVAEQMDRVCVRRSCTRSTELCCYAWRCRGWAFWQRSWCPVKRRSSRRTVLVPRSGPDRHSGHRWFV